MAVDFVCAACAVPVGQTHAEFLTHRRVAHQGSPVTFTARMAPSDRRELYLAHCSRCAAEIRTTVPLADPVPRCRSCQEIFAEGLELPAPNADAAAVNPTRSDPKETNMNESLTIKITTLTPDQARAAAVVAADLPGSVATKTTASFVGEPSAVLAQIRARQAQAKVDAGSGRLPHWASLIRKYEAAVAAQAEADVAADKAHAIVDSIQDRLDAGESLAEIAGMPAADAEEIPAEIVSDTAGDLAPPPAPKGDRIPSGATTFVCRVCGKELPTKKFPTITGPDDRGTTCRPCRDAAKGAPRSPKAKTPRAPRTPKAPAGPKGLDPATAPFGIGGETAAEIDRSFKDAWTAAEVDGTVQADVADKLRDAAKNAHTAIVARSSKKAA